MRHAFLIYLQTAAVLLVGVLTYGLTFLLTSTGPWPYRAAAGLAASAAVYWGAIRSRPRPWVAEREVAPPTAARRVPVRSARRAALYSRRSQ